MLVLVYTTTTHLYNAILMDCRYAGDGLAILTPPNTLLPTRLLTIPFALPSEVVTVHIHRHEPLTFISHGDLLDIVERSPLRDYAEGEKKLEVTRLGEAGSVSEELQLVRNKFGERVQCKYFGKCSGCQVRSSHCPYELC